MSNDIRIQLPVIFRNNHAALAKISVVYEVLQNNIVITIPLADKINSTNVNVDEE